MTSLVPVLAIDGPSGSGKGTVAAKVASALGFRCLDSGALYRILVFQADREGIELDQTAALVDLAETIEVEFVEGRVRLGGADVTDAIRSESVGAKASKIAAVAEIRQALLSLQRRCVRPPGLVADGRDMGTIVFPNANLKIYLTASAEERAQRRHKQLIAKGQGGSLRALVEDISARDDRDMNRKTAPLKPADDSIEIDSTQMTIDEVVDCVLHHWQNR